MRNTLIIFVAFFLVSFQSKLLAKDLALGITVDSAITSTTASGKTVYVTPERLPHFGDCLNSYTYKTLKNCSDRNVIIFINSQIEYPQAAKDNQIEGNVIAQYVVNKEGRIEEPTIIRGLGFGCDQEVIRVLNSLPLWRPGEQNGEKVDVLMKVTLRFELDQDDFSGNGFKFFWPAIQGGNLSITGMDDIENDIPIARDLYGNVFDIQKLELMLFQGKKFKTYSSKKGVVSKKMNKKIRKLLPGDQVEFIVYVKGDKEMERVSKIATVTK